MRLTLMGCRSLLATPTFTKPAPRQATVSLESLSLNTNQAELNPPPKTPLGFSWGTSLKFLGTKISEEEKLKFQEEARQALQARQKMPILLQLMFPLKGKPTLKSQTETEMAIKKDPDLTELAKLTPEAETILIKLLKTGQSIQADSPLVGRPKRPSKKSTDWIEKHIKNLKYDDIEFELLLEHIKKINKLDILLKVLQLNFEGRDFYETEISQIKDAAKKSLHNFDKFTIPSVTTIDDFVKNDTENILSDILVTCLSYGNYRLFKNIINQLNESSQPECLSIARAFSGLLSTAQNIDVIYKEVLRKVAHDHFDVDEAILLNLVIDMKNKNMDGKFLQGVFEAYSEFKNHAYRTVDRFSNTEQQFDDYSLRQYFNSNSELLIDIISKFGVDLLISKYDQKYTKFDNFINNCQKLLYRYENLGQKTIEVFEECTTTENKKLKAHEKANIIDILCSYIQEGHSKEAYSIMNGFLKNKTVSLTKLKKEYLKLFLKSAGITSRMLNEASENILNQWNLKYIQTLASGLEHLYEKDKKRLKDICRLSITGEYWSDLMSAGTTHGKINQKTKQAFKDAALNFDNWLHYNEFYRFPHNNDPYRIQLWKRQPGHDLFVGSYGSGCISLDSNNRKGIVDALTYTLTQFAEIIDENTNESVGYMRFFWATVPTRKHPVLIIDNIHYRDDDSDPQSDNLVQHALAFAKQYAASVY